SDHPRHGAEDGPIRSSYSIACGTKKLIVGERRCAIIVRGAITVGCRVGAAARVEHLFVAVPIFIDLTLPQIQQAQLDILDVVWGGERKLHGASRALPIRLHEDATTARI